MSHKQRIKRLEDHFGADCQQHQAVIVYREVSDVATWQAVTGNELEGTGIDPQLCPRCGESLPLIVVPPKLSVEEWTRRAEAWCTPQTTKGVSHESSIAR